MHILAPFGFYGWGNIGDESTLQGFAQLLAASNISVNVSIASRDPAHTARVEPSLHYFSASRRDPRRWLARLRATAHAVIGGTPIQDIEGDWPLREVAPIVRAARRSKIPMTFIGVGVESLRLGESRRIVAEDIAPYVRHWTVRCERDRDRLVSYGVMPKAITVAADMAWLIEPATSEFGRECLSRWGIDLAQPLIGVNVVNENSLFDRQPQMVDALAAALDEIGSRMSAKVIFLSNEIREDATFDRAAATRVMQRMKRTDLSVLTPNLYFAPKEMMSIISCCNLTISMRYHFCLFSALQRVPFIAIERSDKISDLCWDTGWTARVSSPRFSSLDIVAIGDQLSRSASMVSQNLEEVYVRLRRRALRNVSALHALGLGEPTAAGEQEAFPVSYE